MRKVFTKIICLTAAAIVAAGIFLVSACNNVSAPLSYTSTNDLAESNGGFAVGKGDYVYFINGREDSSADNAYGKPVKGAVWRISKDNLSKRNYSDVEKVVPKIVYSGNSNGGIFIYGDYIYYATPSDDRNSDGEILTSYLAFKSTRLDGTETMNGYFVQLDNNSVEYRYVQDGDDVYLIYVAENENLYGTACKNIHSVNTRTGVNTLLAYNVQDVMFDSENLSNPRVYYTMNVTDFALNTTSGYNQIYSVTASATQPKDYTAYFEEVFKDEEGGYDPVKDPKYVNCGKLVLDGIGTIDEMKGDVTVFNDPAAENITRNALTYTLSKYQDGVLFYTRTGKDITTVSLFMAKDTEIDAQGWNPVTANDTSVTIKSPATSVSGYTYILDENKDISNVIIADSNGLMKTVLNDDGVIATDVDWRDTYHMTLGGQPTVLFTYNHGGVNYIYYSLSGGNGYTVYRISIDGNYSDYNRPSFGGDAEVKDFTPVRVLDLDCASDWYKPEMFCGQLLFQTETLNMTDYAYIMVCDLRAHGSDNVMDNVALDALNDKFDGVKEEIDAIDESVYENLRNALNYAFYSGEALDGEGNGYIDGLIQQYVDVMGYDRERFWSEETVAKYKDFVMTAGDWADYADDKVTVNGKEVTANKRDYYYALLGTMNDADAEAYGTLLKTTYLQPEPEPELSWFEGLSTGAKAGFIIGVVLGGLAVIAAATLTPLLIIRHKRKKMPSYAKKRIKVDTTDDKNIDVYSDGENN